MMEQQTNIIEYFECRICGELVTHKREHPECDGGFVSRFECPECGDLFNRKADAAGHCTGLIETKRVYKVKLYPKPHIEAKLNEWFSLNCELYNAALQERRDAWVISRDSLNYHTQAKQLPDIKADRPEFADVNSHVLQDTLKRLDKAFAAFYRRAKSGAGHRSGFPKFQRRDRFSSFTIPNTRYKIEGKWLDISRLGRIKFRCDREIEGTVKSLTINRDGVTRHRWFASVIVEQKVRALPERKQSIGINIGVKKFAVLSDPYLKMQKGDAVRINKGVIDNPRYYKADIEAVREASRRVSRRPSGSKGWLKAVQQLRDVHRRIAARREHFQHIVSKELVERYQTIAVEDLHIPSMVEERKISRDINDAAWGYFHEKLRYKSEAAGRTFIKVKPFKRNEKEITAEPLPEPTAYIPRKRVAAREILRRAKPLD